MNKVETACHIISDITNGGYADAYFLINLYQIAKYFDTDFFIDKESSFCNLNINDLIYKCLESIRDSIVKRLKKEIKDYINIDLYRQWIKDNIEKAEIYCNGTNSSLYIRNVNVTLLDTCYYEINSFIENLISVMIKEVKKYQEEQV